MTAWLTAAGTIREDAGVGETGIIVLAADVALFQPDRVFSGMSDRYDAPGLDQLGAKAYFSKVLPDGNPLVVRAIKSCASKSAPRGSA